MMGAPTSLARCVRGVAVVAGLAVLASAPTDVLGQQFCGGQPGLVGDVSGDSAVNVLDAQQIARASIGLSVGSPDRVDDFGDVNLDGSVNVLDAQLVARFAADLSVDAPVGEECIGLRALIQSPSRDTTISVGDDLTLVGRAEDPEEGRLTGDALQWSSSVDGALGTGEAVTVSLSDADHVVTLTATDSAGNTDADTVEIGTSQPPSATIEAPTQDTTIAPDAPITFEGTGSDPEDGQLSGESLVWVSDLDGELGTGDSIEVDGGTLSAGTHTVTLRAIDSGGATGTDQVGVTVSGGPAASISSPQGGSVFTTGDSVVLEGSAVDPEDGSLSGSALSWASDLVDGELGTGDSLKVVLPAGEQTVTLTATDSDGLTGSASVGVVINELPTATIDAPSDGSTFTEIDTIAFEGAGSDPEDGALGGDALQWSSSLDGFLGTGESVEATLSPGQHTIRLLAADSRGGTDADSIGLTVEQTGSISGGFLRSNDQTGLEGIRIELSDDQGTVIATDTTDANGTYGFQQLTAASYTVTPVSADVPEFGSFTTSESVSVDLSPGQAATADFEFQVPEVTLNTSLSSTTVSVGDVVTVTVAVQWDTSVITEPLSAATGSSTIGDGSVATEPSGACQDDQTCTVGSPWGAGTIDDGASLVTDFNLLAPGGVGNSPATLITYEVEATGTGSTDITADLSELKTIDADGNQTELTDFIVLNAEGATLTVQ